MIVLATRPYAMDAEALALAIDSHARRIGPNRWAARCVSHDDRHPSLHISNGRNGRIVFVCRSGCAQAEVLGELRNRGLWPDRPTYAPQRKRFDWRDHFDGRPRLTECCHAEQKCSHWKKFDREIIVAHLRHQLGEMVEEIRALYRTANYALDDEELRHEIRLAIDVGGLETLGASDAVVDALIEKVAAAEVVR